MSFEQAIHSHWQASPALVTLVPPHRLFTGVVPTELSCEDESPEGSVYASLLSTGSGGTLHTSSGTRLLLARARLQVSMRSIGALEQMAEEVIRAFDRAELQWVGGRALNVRVARESVSQDPVAGRWTVAMTLESLVQC